MNLPHHTSLIAVLTHTLVCLALLTMPAPLHAEDAVLIVPHGGVRELPALEIIEDQVDAWRVTQAPSLELLGEDEPLDVFSDVKVLPNQTALVSGFEQLARAQAVLVDPGQSSSQLIWQADNGFSNVNSISVALSFTPGDPSRILLTDSNASLVQIWDRDQQTFVWRQSVFVQGARAFIVQAIALPGNRIVSASNWPAISVGGVDVFNLTPEPDELATYRIASQTYPGAPDTLRIQPALQDVRDVVALDAETLLVTTINKIFTMNLEGELGWQLDKSALEGVQGEFASARVLPSGRIALATFEPGQWIAPHPNHRIHWFEQGADTNTPPTLLISSSPLDRAPKKLASAQSTGGTGTLGYEGNFEGGGGEGDVEAITLSSLLSLSSDRVAPGESLNASITFSNPTTNPITPKRLAVRGVPGSNCQLGLISGSSLIESELEPRINPLGVYVLEGSWPVTEQTVSGTWCIYPAIQREDDSWRSLTASRVTFTVAGGIDGAPIPIEELPFEEFSPGPDPDMGSEMPQDMSSIIVIPVEEDSTDGCGCQQSNQPTRLPLEGLLLFICLGFGKFATQRRRARSRFMA